MSKQIDGWIMGRDLRASLELLSRYVEYAFDDTDWDTVEIGVRDTDDEKSDGWYSYPLAGTSATLEVSLAHSVGSEVTSVSVTGVETLNSSSGPTLCCPHSPASDHSLVRPRPDEGGRVLPEGHRHPQKPAVDAARHPHLAQDVVADEPEFDDTRLDVPHVHGVNTPVVPQSFGRGGHVRRFLPGGEPQPYAEARRVGSDHSAARGNRPYLPPGGGRAAHHGKRSAQFGQRHQVGHVDQPA